MAELTPLPESPLVSIIVPSYNQGGFIRQTIESGLAQDYRPIEIIVVDGASTDQTVEVLKSFGEIPELNWVSEPDGGVVDAVNKGVRKARGQIAAIQSSDDAYLPGALRQAVEGFRGHPGAALVYGDTVKIDAEGKELSRLVTKAFSMTNFLSKRTIVLQPAAFFRRDAFLAVGGWSSDYFNADTECWLRMVLQYPAVKLNAFWALRRMHKGQRDAQDERILESYRRMMVENTSIQLGPLAWRSAARCGMLRHEMRYGRARSALSERWLRMKAWLAWPPTLWDQLCRVPARHHRTLRNGLSRLCPLRHHAATEGQNG